MRTPTVASETVPGEACRLRLRLWLGLLSLPPNRSGTHGGFSPACPGPHSRSLRWASRRPFPLQETLGAGGAARLPEGRGLPGAGHRPALRHRPGRLLRRHRRAGPPLLCVDTAGPAGSGGSEGCVLRPRCRAAWPSRDRPAPQARWLQPPAPTPPPPQAPPLHRGDSGPHRREDNTVFPRVHPHSAHKPSGSESAGGLGLAGLSGVMSGESWRSFREEGKSGQGHCGSPESAPSVKPGEPASSWG